MKPRENERGERERKRGEKEKKKKVYVSKAR